MIVKSPLKKKRSKKNVRKSPAGRRNGTSQSSDSHTAINYGRRIKKEDYRMRRTFPGLKPWKIIVTAIVIGAAGVLYLNHVFATRQMLKEVRQLEREYQQTQRMHNSYRLVYDRMTGPAEIYDNAKAMGFINGGPAEKVIEVDE